MAIAPINVNEQKQDKQNDKINELIRVLREGGGGGLLFLGILDPIGAWDSGTTYQKGDVVSNDGTSYVAKVETTNNEPPNDTYWVILAEKGDTGATGATGPTGPEADIAGQIVAADAKTTLVDADLTALVDSEASNVLKRLTWANLKATLKTYLDTLYVPLARTVSASGLATGGGDLSANRTITVTAAVASDLWTGTSTTTANTPDALTDAHAIISVTPVSTTFTPDQSAGTNFLLTLTDNSTLAMMSNLKNGRGGTIWVVQDGSGTNTLDTSAYLRTSAFTVATGANDITILGYQTNQAGNDVALWLVGSDFT